MDTEITLEAATRLSGVARSVVVIIVLFRACSDRGLGGKLS